ncbi:penicillin-binding transpeptidase domain-containing protein [uncultured Fibrobacter sp.]|uniref:penicillin-binding transpeptidase domain-containing protein n=1 Tax=uncultured Fibrobacter sp. TaxID=261512 RepID=UPI0025CD51FE|nr:penicillin-binding transpeptidase domain-containing protein [uncultured Fibrobacter sp.]
MERLPYAQRMRNRCIAITVLVTIIVGIVHCSTKDDPAESAKATTEQLAADTVAQAIATNDTNPFDESFTAETAAKENSNGLAALKGIEDEDFEKSGNTAAGNDASAFNATSESTDNVRDTVHIKSQKDPVLADRIDILLRRYHPDLGVILVVDTKTNEIIAWGERRDGKVQNKPDWIGRPTFPAASLAKLVTIAAAMESNRYSLNTPIPMIGRHHTLYLNQLRVPEKYNGPTMELSEAFARSANPPMAIVGKNVGAKRLNAAAAKLGYNKNFPGNAPNASHYTAPDTGYGLAEVSCGFTTSTTLTPLLAAAQVRAILTKKPLEIPWARDMDPFAPQKPLALNLGKFTENTYYGLRESMLRSVTQGTARKHMSTKNMARKNFEALRLGGKTGSLDGTDPAGRYDWFMGFAEAKNDPSKSIVVIVMQMHKEIRSQPATQVAATVINYWAHQNLDLKK